jgi:hypothetical protein
MDRWAKILIRRQFLQKMDEIKATELKWGSSYGKTKIKQWDL